ncbi:MAG: hypothetical protein R3E01_25365 [Pirellulaceae bacterium]
MISNAQRVMLSHPVTEQAERRLFWRLRTQIVAQIVRQALSGSRLRTSIVVALSLFFWGGIYFLFYDGFLFVDRIISHGPTRTQAVHAVYNVFFLALLVMITMSSAIILFSALYRSEETRFLLTTPARVRRIVLYKFEETALFSAWGFLLLGTPMLMAYGRVTGAPWYYYAFILPFVMAFVAIPVGLGSVLCLVVVRYLPRFRLHALAAVGVTAVVIGVWLIWSLVTYREHEVMTPLWFQESLARLRYSEQRFLPSWWLSTGLLEAAHPAEGHTGASIKESLGFLSVLISNALVVHWIVGAVGGRLFVPGLSALIGHARQQRVGKTRLVDRWLERSTRLFPRDMQLLLLKDLRTFRRDPMQWTQFAIFFGLLMIYFFNVRRLQFGDVPDNFLIVIGFLNVTVVGLILSTFTTRFIFPMISLEGSRFWILGTLPVTREHIVWSKFLFACAVSIVPCCSLVVLSDLMLNVLRRFPVVALIHVWICLLLCIGLSAVAVGLGAAMPNFREASPSKIAAGFGGTLNLVLSAAYILLTILLVSVPCYFWLDPGIVSNRGGLLAQLPEPIRLGQAGAVVMGLVLAFALAMAVTIIPMRMGFRSFRHLET